MEERLRRLSDDELVERLVQLVATEKKATVKVVEHLAEVERRRLYATLGFPSLYEYTVRKLGYSNAAAMRRIKVARAGARLPKVFEYLSSDEVTLSSLDICTDLLCADGGAETLEELRGKSKEDALRMVARKRPVEIGKLRDKVEIVVAAGSPSGQTQFGFDAKENHLRGGNEVATSAEEEQVRINFTAKASFMEKLKHAQQLLFAGDKDDLLFENVFEKALDTLIARRCPKERMKRRKARIAKRKKTLEGGDIALANSEAPKKLKRKKKVEGDNSGPTEPKKRFVRWANGEIVEYDEPGEIPPWCKEVPEPGSKEEAEKLKAEKKRTRRIPIWLRDQVLERDGYRCTFITPQGWRCECTWDLDIDHTQPYSLGGRTCMRNLRTLCSSHNLLEEIRVFKEHFVKEKIAAAAGRARG